VHQYTIQSDGSLAPLSKASVSTGVGPSAIIADPGGRFVYVSNSGDGTISQYSVGATGSLTALSPAFVSVSGQFFPPVGLSLSVDPKSRFLYAVVLPHDPPGTAASIAQYAISSDGTLTPLAPAYVSVPSSIVGPLAIDPNGQYAYAAGWSSAPGGQVSQYAIGSDGMLSPLTPATVAASQTAIGVAVAPSDQTAYVLSTCVDSTCDGQVALYSIGANGALMAGSNTLTGGHVNPVALVADGTGSNAYLLANFMGVDTNTGAVYQYAIDSTGTLVSDTPASLGVSSGALAESTYGSHLYVLSANYVGFASGAQTGGYIDSYNVGTDGRLSAANTTPIVSGRLTGMTLVVAQ
jgi:6-phosphogluconolactonase (cycloisomerase 2 family)